MRRSATVHVDTFTPDDVVHRRIYVVPTKDEIYICGQVNGSFRWQGVRSQGINFLTMNPHNNLKDAVVAAINNGWTVYEFDDQIDFAENLADIMP